MSDRIPKPTVLTSVRLKGFTLNVYAYRILTKEEGKQALHQWLVANNRKFAPKTGVCEYYTIFGYDS